MTSPADLSAPDASAYYEHYWKREYHDPLSAPRAELLWQCLDEADPAPSRLLDAGCGDGSLVSAAAQRGLETEGFDISATAVERAQRAAPESTFNVHSAERLPWPVRDASFDVVVAFEVIEHLFYPGALVAGAQAALRPGGHLALSTPYHGRLKNLAISLGAFERHFAVEGQHIRFFTDRSLRGLLNREGFADLRFLHLGRGPGLWANSFVWARKSGP